MGKNIVIANTKGGTGKTVLSTQILPLIYNNATIFEIDNNNKTTLSKSKLQINNLNLQKIDDAIIDVETNENVNIIDLGGGDDTINAIKIFSENFVEVNAFYVPIFSDFEHIHNLISTLNLIKQHYSNANIYIILNKAKSTEIEALKEQFVFFFGSNELNIKNVSAEITKNYNVKGIFALQDTFLISYVKNILNTTLSDVVANAREIGDLRVYKNEKLKELKEKYKNDKNALKEEYKKILSFINIVNKVNNYVNNVKKMFNGGV